jgi:hypothetical protein
MCTIYVAITTKHSCKAVNITTNTKHSCKATGGRRPAGDIACRRKATPLSGIPIPHRIAASRSQAARMYIDVWCGVVCGRVCGGVACCGVLWCGVVRARVWGEVGWCAEGWYVAYPPDRRPAARLPPDRVMPHSKASDSPSRVSSDCRCTKCCLCSWCIRVAESLSINVHASVVVVFVVVVVAVVFLEVVVVVAVAVVVVVFLANRYPTHEMQATAHHTSGKPLHNTI